MRCGTSGYSPSAFTCRSAGVIRARANLCSCPNDEPFTFARASGCAALRPLPVPEGMGVNVAQIDARNAPQCLCSHAAVQPLLRGRASERARVPVTRRHSAANTRPLPNTDLMGSAIACRGPLVGPPCTDACRRDEAIACRSGGRRVFKHIHPALEPGHAPSPAGRAAGTASPCAMARVGAAGCESGAGRLAHAASATAPTAARVRRRDQLRMVRGEDSIRSLCLLVIILLRPYNQWLACGTADPGR